MPNFSTFNRNADDLRTSIFGTEADGTVRAARVDNQGRLDIVGEVTVETIGLVETVTTIQGGTINSVNTVDAVTTIQGGTINSVNTVDAVTTIQGGTINNVNTVDEVTTIVSISQQNFVEDDVQNVDVTGTTFNDIPEVELRRDTQLFKVYTYFVTNQTTNTLDVRIEVSPNDIDWFNDVEINGILDETVAIVPQRFGKYTRVQYRAEVDSTTIDVWFNAQG